ncbi:MAG: hypothetical protein AAF581_07395 [Planctomycetota bacterium]
MPQIDSGAPHTHSSSATAATLLAIVLTVVTAATSCTVGSSAPDATDPEKACLDAHAEEYGPPGASARTTQLPPLFVGAPDVTKIPFMDGVALGLFSADKAYDYRMLLQEIADTGAGWVSLCINFYQDKVDSSEVGIDAPHTATWERITCTIRQAHALGLRVFIFPILLIQNPGENDWRGTIQPTNRDAWYSGYHALILRIAKLAAAEKAEMLSIGSEFNSMQTDTARWRALIADVRAVYPGLVTYSVNWDSLEDPEFFDALDIIGMTTYFSLTDKDDPTVAELQAKLTEIRDDVLTWQFQHKMPLLFTEVGFPSQDGANKDPWNYYISTVPDLGEQRDCYEAFTNVWDGVPGLHGLFFYNWFGVGGAQDTGYTPRGKPAAAIIRQWFQRHSKSAAPVPATTKGSR